MQGKDDGDADRRLIESLYRIAGYGARLENPAEASRKFLEEVRDFFDAATVVLFLASPDTGRLEREASLGFGEQLPRQDLLPGEGLAGWVAYQRKALLVRAGSNDPRIGELREGIRALMVVPMEREGQVVGVVQVETAAEHLPDERDLDRLRMLGEEATQALDRIWRLAHLNRKAAQLEIIVGLGQTLVSKLEIGELVGSVAHETRRLLGCRLCTIQFFDEAAEEARLMAAFPPEAAGRAMDSTWRLEECLAAAVRRTRKPMEFFRLDSPEYLDFPDLPPEATNGSLLSTPITSEDGVIGAINTFTAGPHRFADDERRLVQALAGLTSVAVQNARLYARVFQSEDSLRRNEKLTTLGLLAAEIAHEIRNPLTVLKLLFGSLGLDFASDDPRSTDAAIIREKLNQLEGIVGKVLSFAKAPESLHSRWSIDEIIRDTCLLVRLKLHQSQIHLHYLPPESPLTIEGNKGQIQQVMLNLILNATEAMPGGGAITISCRERAEAGHRFSCIEVDDTGKGIPEAIRGRIFESLLTGGPEGGGLGLSIVKRIVESHRGRVEVKRTGPAGTTMEILLPAV
ncbi:MAG: GAF domain-containing protein [Puniceicoccaceae bacterium]|nr:MAG: GAF domain-containing protein [Puniceicoccaceae bacterium]